MKSKQIKPKQPRNWNAVAAQFRNSAGAMKEKPTTSHRDIYEEIMEGMEELRRQREENR